MSNVNVGKRTRKQDAEAAQALADNAAAQGEQIIEEDGAKWAVSKAFGLTIKTRIA